MKEQAKDSKKRVTIYSVAREAGVSLATVSRVINESDAVKEDTKRRVQEAIIKLGYKPNAVAQGLALKKTTNIALIIPDSSFTYIGKVLNGLLDVAKIYKYNIILHTTSVGVNEMNEIIDNVIKSHADGIVLYNDLFTEKELQILQGFEIPMVYLDVRNSGPGACCVYVDYRKAVHDLVTRYLDRGIEDIVVVDDKKNPINVKEVLCGVEEAFAEKGKKFEGFIEIPENAHSSYDYLKKYFKVNRHKLIITYRDSQAIAVLNTCAENGISIPEETEVVCVKSSRYTDMVRPQISSFVVPSYDLGSLGMRILTKMLNGDHIQDKEFKLNYVYKAKGSTRY
ncbi:MAG: LacI family DNA-binding transcriptional regulator [Erysipelotrichaceae bacterium]|nr:LacI family DNA-binding transcriptional regulator [Erysipelotrichaceae bacterium]